MATPEGTIADVLAYVGDDPARAQEALDAERAGANRSTLIDKLETIAAKEANVSEETTEAPAPEEVPAPQPPAADEIVLDLADPATTVGPANLRDEDSEKPEDSFDLREAAAEDEDPIDAEPVEFFQVASNSGAAALRFDDVVVVLNRQQLAALARDLRSAMAGVTY